MVGDRRSLTAVPGISVGHAGDGAAATGCTAVLGPFRAAVEVRGLATGSRGLDVLSRPHLVSRADGLLLTGGSAFGLAAADGVIRWLEERERGFRTRAATIPIVPAAVIYDLGVGSATVRPDADMGYRAASAASRAPVSEGRVGAGTGATVGNFLGPEGAEPGGVGSWSRELGAHRIGALAVVNAFGDVRDDEGRILAGCRGPDGSFADTAGRLRNGEVPPGFTPGENTTLGVVATDRTVGRAGLEVVARQAADALARHISPAGTLLDGDMVFALSTGAVGGSDEGFGSVPGGPGPEELLGLGAAAEEVLARAMMRAVEVPAVGGAEGAPGERGGGGE